MTTPKVPGRCADALIKERDQLSAQLTAANQRADSLETANKCFRQAVSDMKESFYNFMLALKKTL